MSGGSIIQALSMEHETIFLSEQDCFLAEMRLLSEPPKLGGLNRQHTPRRALQPAMSMNCRFHARYRDLVSIVPIVSYRSSVVTLS